MIYDSNEWIGLNGEKGEIPNWAKNAILVAVGFSLGFILIMAAVTF